MVRGLFGPRLPSCLGSELVVVGVTGPEEEAVGFDGTGLDDGMTAFSPV